MDQLKALPSSLRGEDFQPLRVPKAAMQDQTVQQQLCKDNGDGCLSNRVR